MILTALRSALNVVGPHALLTEQAHDGIDQGKDKRISGGLREGQMEIEIPFDEAFRIESTIHDGDGFAHRGTGVLVGTLGGQCGDFRLEDLADFDEMNGAFGGTSANHTIQSLTYGAGGSIGHKSTAAGEGLHHTLFAERLHGFPNRGAAHPELLGEFPLGGQLLSALQVAFENGVLDLLNDLFVQAQSLDNFVHKSSRDRIKREALPGRELVNWSDHHTISRIVSASAFASVGICTYITQLRHNPQTGYGYLLTLLNIWW